MLLTTCLDAGEKVDDNLQWGGHGAETERHEGREWRCGRKKKQRQTKTKKATKKKDDWLENVKLQK